MANDLTTSQLKRLRAAKDYSYKKLEAWRKNRTQTIKAFVGSHYSDNGAPDKVPVNFLELAVSIYAHQLAAQIPRASVMTKAREMRSVAADFGRALNDHIEYNMKLDSVFRAAVVDALFSIGIVKVGRAPKGEVKVGNIKHVINEPFADAVSLDDWVHDVAAKNWDQVQFCGNRYRMPLHQLEKAGLLKDDKKNGTEPDTERKPTNVTGEEKASSITDSAGRGAEDFRKTVELWDIWIPEDNIIITVREDDDTFSKPLKIVEFQGPRHGPYHLLGFTAVPDNVMPLAPTSLWRDLHELSNRMFRKMGRQADRQKTVTAVRGGHEGDGKAIVEASDGDTVRVDDPSSVNQLKYGGVEGGNLAFSLQLRDLFSYFGGNLDSLGGLSPQTETVGQENLLSANASKRMQDMQSITQAFDKKVIEDVGFYMWNDPVREYPVEIPIPGTDVRITSSLRPEQRQEDFYQLAVDVEPYSMLPQTPARQLQAITGIISQVMVPLMPMFVEQGMSINGEGLIKRLGRLAHIPDLEEIISFVSTPPAGAPGNKSTPDAQRGAVTRHVSERVSRPGATQGGKDAAMLQAIMSDGNMQASEFASVGRPTG